MQTPRVFISYSSEDRDSVRTLAEGLRSNGVNAWYAEWEIGPGDSFVQKINEGLEGCDKFLIVVSESSVRSRWVQEELSSAVVRRIENEADIIPVRLDDTPVPAVINHLHWVGMPPFRDEFEKLLKAIFGVSDRPPIGAMPEFINRGLERRQTAISGFSPEASAILRYLVSNLDLFETVSDIELAEALGVDEVEISDGIEELEEQGLVRTMGGTLLEVTPKAPAWLYVESDYLGFDPFQDMLAVAQCAVGYGQVDTGTLETDTGLPPKRLNIAALTLQAYDCLKLTQPIGTAPYVFAKAQATRHTRQWLREHR
jgi:hypothetical protein